MRLHRILVAGNPGIGGHQFHQRHGRGAERKAGIATIERRGHPQGAGHVDYRVVTHFGLQPHRRHVGTLRKGIGQRDAVGIAATGIARAVGALGNLGIGDQVIRLPPGIQCGEVDEQLEGGADLSPGLGGAVERAGGIIGAADHRHHLAIGTHGHQRHLRTAQGRPLHGLAGKVLQPRIERGGQRLADVADLAARPRLGQGPVGEIGTGRQVVPLAAHVERGDRHGVGLLLRQVSGRDQGVAHQPHSLGRAVEVAGGGKTAGCLQQAGQHRRLFGPQVFRLAVEVMQARRAQAIGVVAEIGVGQVPLQDLVLGQPGFQPEGDQRLARLAGERLFGREEGELGELLGDGGAAAHAGEKRPGNAARINAPVAVEATILDRQERLDDMVGQLRHVDRIGNDRAVAGNRRAVAGEQGDLRRGDRLERLGKRRGDRQVTDQQDEGEQCARNPANDPPAAAAHRLAGHWWR